MGIRREQGERRRPRWLFPFVGIGLMMAFRGLVGCSGGLVMGVGEDPSRSLEGGDGGPTVDGGDPVPVVEDALPCDVDSVVALRCRTCHGKSPAFGAPNALVTPQDFLALRNGEPVSKRMVSRIHDARSPMPPASSPPLTAEEQKVLDSWVAAGTPMRKSNTSCADPSPPKAPVEPLPCQPDFDFLPKKAFDVPATVKNEYVCYGFEVDSKEKKHLTGFAPSINNTKVVHHVLLFQSSVPVDTFHHSCSAVVPSTAKLISGWAPGAGNLVMPSEAGYPIPTGKSYWFLQIHYNNGLALSAQSDSSGFRACSTTALRKFDADTVAFGSTLFFIPPRATKTLSCEAAVEGSWTSDGPDTLHLIAAWPHMHKLGTAFEMTRVPANGQPGSAIVNVPKYSFEDQIIYPVTVDLARGDKVRTRCTWKNDGDAIVRVGERTEDEMCFGFLTYYPRAPYPRWDSPSKSSQQGGPAVCQ